MFLHPVKSPSPDRMALDILILTDGKMGDLAQCRGVAGGLTRNQNITEVVVEPGWLTALPLPNMPLSAVDRQASMFSKQWDCVIASGRRTVPYLRAFKSRANRPVFTVYLKDPKFNRNDIDFIWAPSHDRLVGENVFSTPTSPHTISGQSLLDARQSAEERFAHFDGPMVGLILGGDSKSVTWTQSAAEDFAQQLLSLPNNATLLMVASRRTPNLLIAELERALSNRNLWVWDGNPPNPYTEVLAISDRLVITGDSHNMVSESLATGKPVHVYRPPGLQEKLKVFLDMLEDDNLIESLSMGFDRESADPHDATELIVAEIQRRYALWVNGRDANPA